MIEEQNTSEQDKPVAAVDEMKDALKNTAIKFTKAVSAIKQSPACPCCGGAGVAIADGYECAKCGTVYQTPTEPTLNGKTFGELFTAAKSGDSFVFPGAELRSLRSLGQLADQNVTSVYSNGGIVAALVRAGFHVSEHAPDVIFEKP